MPRLLFNPFSGTFDYVLRPGEGQVTGEVPSGVIDNANTDFTTANDFQPGTERVYYNGERLKSGAGNDYTISESGGLGTGFDTIIELSKFRTHSAIFCNRILRQIELA